MVVELGREKSGLKPTMTGLKKHHCCLRVDSPPAHAQLIFRQLTENQALELSYSPQRNDCSLMGLSLYHRSPQSQTTLLSMAWGDKLRVNPEYRGRLQVCGGLSSPLVNVTLSNLQPGDAGFYMWELSCEICNSAQHISGQKVFLLVERTGTSLPSG